jgi:hypothetical protein
VQKKRWPTADGVLLRDFSVRKFALTELQGARERRQEQVTRRNFCLPLPFVPH